MLDFTRTKEPTSIVGMSQIEMEELYSKYQLTDAIRGYFVELGAEVFLLELGIPVRFGLDLIIQMSLHKRCAPEVMTGILRHHFEDEQNPAQACLDMIVKACEADVCNYDPISGYLVLEFDISKELQLLIDQFQYPLPMIEAPQEVTNNRQSGYQTIRRSIILKDNHHENDVCLDHINRVNAQRLSINPDIVAFVQNSWKNLDHKKAEETDEEFEKRQRAFEKFDTSSRDVLAGLMAMGDGFWLTHAYDKRGRTYTRGYHVNYQGNDWCKACIQFADAEPLNDV